MVDWVVDVLDAIGVFDGEDFVGDMDRALSFGIVSQNHRQGELSQ